MQDRKTYAKGSTLESTTGYVVKVGMPVVDDTVTANENGNAEFTVLNPYAAGLNPYTAGQFLVTIEVNGEAIAYKETVTIEDGEVSVGEYDISIDEDDATIGVAAGDIVRLLIEPLEVSVSDGFRAAIKKAVPQSGGSTGGGILVVHMGDGDALDKTWREIDAADVAVVAFSGIEGGETWHSREFVTGTSIMNGDHYVTTVYDGGSAEYLTSDPDDYPVRQ